MANYFSLPTEGDKALNGNDNVDDDERSACGARE